MRHGGQGGRGYAALLGVLCVAALFSTGAGCGDGGTVVLVTVVGLNNQAAELAVVATLDSGGRQPFPRQSLASSLSASQQFGVLLPAGVGGAVSIEVDAYLGDCLIQKGQALVVLSGEPMLMARVALGDPTTCAPFQLQVKGAGAVTSPDAPSVNCGPDAQCMYWLDATHSYTFTATPGAGEVAIDWLIDGAVEPDCAGQLQCPLTLSASGHQVTVVFNPLCDRQIALAPVTPLSLLVGTSLRAIWGIAGQEAYAVGDAGTVVRFRGTTKTWDVLSLKDMGGPPISDSLAGVWGSGNPAALMIVGSASTQGSAYGLIAPVNSPPAMPIVTTTSQSLPMMPLAAVAGVDLMNLWAVGGTGTALRWNNTTLKFEAPVVTGTPPISGFTGAWVSDDAGHPLWTASDKSQLFSLAGAAWTVLTTAGSNVKLLGMSGDSSGIYAVGPQSTVVRLGRGSGMVPALHRVATAGSDSNRTLSAVWAGGGYVVAVGDGGSVFCSRSSGAYWTRLPVPGLLSANFLGVYGSGKHLWVVGQNGTTGVVAEGVLP